VTRRAIPAAQTSGLGFAGVRGWIVAGALAVVTLSAGIGLWVTWDSTRVSESPSLTAAGGPELLADSTTTDTIMAPTTTTTIPACGHGDEPVEGDPQADWATIVVDTNRSLPPEFAPPDLVEVTGAGFSQLDRVRQFVIPDLAALRQAAEASGTPIVIISAYRSYAYQQGLYEDEVARVGEARAATTVARPGHSEHQLGTAIDVLDAGSGALTPAFADTPTGQWIAAHAHEYGFVLSYPANARDRSCYEFEPWHLRYVGRDIAAQIHESGVPPREWFLLTRDRGAG
jgi:D-alanyl-D-alanine carboxypeptidase